MELVLNARDGIVVHGLGRGGNFADVELLRVGEEGELWYFHKLHFRP